MSDGKEQYANSAFNRAAEAELLAYRDKTRFARALGADEPAIGKAVIETQTFKDNAPLQQLAIDMAKKGADMTAAALWAPPRNQYEPLFPRYPDVITQGDTRYARPNPLAQPVQSMFPSPGPLLGTMTGRSTSGQPPQQRPKGVVLNDGDTVTVTTTVDLDAIPERDPDGLDPHTPGAKLDAGKTPLRKGALEQFPRALMAVADVSAFGAAKYTWGGWQTVPDGVQRYLDAGARHAALRAMGELIDKDSGLSHLAQEAWNILAALELALRKAHDNI